MLVSIDVHAHRPNWNPNAKCPKGTKFIISVKYSKRGDYRKTNTNRNSCDASHPLEEGEYQTSHKVLSKIIVRHSPSGLPLDGKIA